MPAMRRVGPDSAIHELEYVVVDVETTGRAYDGPDRVTEVAAVVVRAGRVAESFSTLVNPGRGIAPAVQRLTGITNAMVARAASFGDVASEVAALLEGRVFVAHNARFDWACVSGEFERASGEPLAGDQLCTVRLARRLLPYLPRRNLDAVAAHYGVEITARHRALGDATATAAIFTRMLDELGKTGVHTWDELMRMITGRKKRKRTALPHPVFDFRIA